MPREKCFFSLGKLRKKINALFQNRREEKKVLEFLTRTLLLLLQERNQIRVIRFEGKRKKSYGKTDVCFYKTLAAIAFPKNAISLIVRIIT